MASILHRILGKKGRTPYRSALDSAHLALSHRDYESAAHHFETAYKLSPKSVELMLQIAHCHKELGHVADAKKWYQLYISTTPSDFSAQRYLDEMDSLLGTDGGIDGREADGDVVIASSNEIDQRNREVGIILRSANSSFRDKDWISASELFKTLCTTYKSKAYLVMLGHCYKEMGNYEQALDAYSSYVSFSETKGGHDYFDGLVQLGHLYKLGGENKLALSSYMKASNYSKINRVRTAYDAEVEIKELAGIMFPTLRFD